MTTNIIFDPPPPSILQFLTTDLSFPIKGDEYTTKYALTTPTQEKQNKKEIKVCEIGQFHPEDNAKMLKNGNVRIMISSITKT